MIKGIWGGLGLALWVCLACCQQAPPDLPKGTQCATPFKDPDRLWVAGSGSNVPLMQQILHEDPSLAHVTLGESIGTSGAVRALRDGAIDLGMASRELSAQELGQELVQTPWATTSLAFVAHPEVRVQRVKPSLLVDMMRGTVSHWSTGEPVVLLVREEGDSGERLLKQHLPQVAQAMAEARDTGRALVLHTDQAMEEALLTIPGAVGTLDLGLARLHGQELRPLSLKSDGDLYLIEKTLFLIRRKDAPESVLALAEKLCTPEVGVLMQRSAYVPAQ